jgi:alpha-glucoside transport system permease protein
MPLSFLAPALVLLGVWIVYPAIATFVRSFWDDRGNHFVWFQNYSRMFSDATIQTAIKNNVIWIVFGPLLVTVLGLVFAVLAERIGWASIFKVVVFMPLAISLFAVGVIWRIMYQHDPSQGAINAGIQVVHNQFSTPGVLPDAQPSSPSEAGGTANGIVLKTPLHPGGVARLGLTAISVSDLPASATQAVDPKPKQGSIVGVVWRDFSPSGGKPGVVDKGEIGVPGVKLDLLQGSKKVQTVTSGNDGTFAFDSVGTGTYEARVAPATFSKGFGGVNFLGSRLITPSIIVAFLWTAVGFAMVIIGAGLAAIPRDTIEAARTDGATEFQVFKRVTVPQLVPVLTVVFVTQIIGVLKLFDIIYAIAPGSTQNDATTLAFEMWKRSFSGENRFGFGAAIASFLMLLFVPFLIYQVIREKKNA